MISRVYDIDRKYVPLAIKIAFCLENLSANMPADRAPMSEPSSSIEAKREDG